MEGLPLKQDENLVVVELPEETLVYDRQHTRAHCLNRTAAAIWSACDGRADRDEIVARAEGTLGAQVTPEMVGTALDQLERARLVAGGGGLPNDRDGASARVTRRALVAGAAVALVPVVTSMLAPKPAAAATVFISSRNAKDAISDVGDTSGALLQLHPVMFRYKPEYDDGSRRRQYGLIAEEVAAVLPDLVVFDGNGAPVAVRYELLPPMLLNEVQRQDARLREQAARLEAQQREIETLRSQLRALVGAGTVAAE